MKKLTVFILAALIAITCVSTVLAANWVEISKDNNFIHSVDVSSVRRTGNTFRLWSKLILRTPQKQAELKKALGFSKTPAYYVVYGEYKIDEPAQRFISITYYAKDDTCIVTVNGFNNEWNICPPCSVGDGMWHYGRRVLGLEWNIHSIGTTLRHYGRRMFGLE